MKCWKEPFPGHGWSLVTVAQLTASPASFPALRLPEASSLGSLLPCDALTWASSCAPSSSFLWEVLGWGSIEHTESSPVSLHEHLLLVLSREPLSGLPNSFPGISSGQWLPCLLPPSLLASMPVGVSGLDSSSFPLLSQYLTGLVGGSPSPAQVPPDYRSGLNYRSFSLAF